MRYLAFSLPIMALAALGAAVTSQPAPAAGPANPAIRGKMVFLRCAACHSIAPGAPNKVGPNLSGIAGRAAGAVPRFNYSPAMRSARLRWDDATLDRWLARPAGVVPGTSMVFAGLANADDRRAVIAYLKKPVP